MEPPRQLRNPLSNLTKYYLACLTKDVERDLGEFASSRYGTLAYAELPTLPILPGSSNDGWDDPAVRAILSSFRNERRQLALYVGYPVRLVRIRARSGWEGFRVEPLMAFEMKFDRGDAFPELIDAIPDINLKALRQLTGAEGTEVLDESLLLQEELGFADALVDEHRLEEALSRIAEVRTGWPWCEELCPGSLDRFPALSEMSTEGIYNRAIVLTPERSQFTRGLEEELRTLGEKSPQSYRDTALANWIAGGTSTDVSTNFKSTFLEVLPLNTEQRIAVQRALTRPLSVVTGPPGTGKSQVLASIVLNCAWRGEKVLVASKNNKAVDVVEERVNTFGPRPLLLRLGPNRYERGLAEYLSTLLSTTSEPGDESAYQHALAEYQGKQRKRQYALEQLDELISARNAVDELEQGVEDIRERVGPNSFARIRDLDISQAYILLDDAQHHVRRACREQQAFLTRMLWPFLRASRLKDAVEASRRVETLNRDLALPPIPFGVDDGAPLLEALGRLGDRIREAEHAQEYFSALEHLNDFPTTSEITNSLMSIGRQLRSTSHRLWGLWLQLQSARLMPGERSLLGDYKALLEMKISADASGERIGGKAFRQFIQMFPALTKLLPAWAVTNLSARGRLPLEPGFFDLVVIDEASQCDIASVLPLLYRSKRAVIIGDPKQLKHITQISEQANEHLLDQHDVHEIGARWSYTANSLYDLAASMAEGVSLRDHHRSAAEVIGFSNRYFYEDRLRVATNQDNLRFPAPDEPAVRWVQVQGNVRRPSTGSALNREEASAVVGELERLLVEWRYSGSVGVVTPFRSQANRIRELVHQNDRIMQVIGASELIVDTVHRFQGDERDVILFSPVVSKSTPRSTLRFLANNTNTFNVAVTRARASLIVVGDHSACASCGVSHLEAFAHYAASIRNPGPDEGFSDQSELGPAYPSVSNPEQVSDWERWFYGVLYQSGLRPIPQFPVEHYVLDFAVLDGDRMLAIEIDGEYYHRAWTGELARRDQIRNGRLIELGWDVMRFWVYQIRDNTDECVERVLRWKQESRMVDRSGNKLA